MFAVLSVTWPFVYDVSRCIAVARPTITYRSDSSRTPTLRINFASKGRVFNNITMRCVQCHDDVVVVVVIVHIAIISTQIRSAFGRSKRCCTKIGQTPPRLDQMNVTQSDGRITARHTNHGLMRCIIAACCCNGCSSVIILTDSLSLSLPIPKWSIYNRHRWRYRRSAIQMPCFTIEAHDRRTELDGQVSGSYLALITLATTSSGRWRRRLISMHMGSLNFPNRSDWID